MTGASGQRVVVAGASLGGLRAAEGLRAAGFTGEVVVVGDEPHMPYNRPPLSKEALAGDLAFSALEFRRRKSVDDVTWRLGSAVAEASLGTREVILADGSVLPFDGLVVATGLRVRRLTLPAPEAGRYAVRTLEDAVALRADLRPGARVVVIGAGFIGCEVAATAVGLGCEVDVVAPEDVPMQRPLGPEVGAAMQRRHEAHGVRMHLHRLPAVVEARTTGADADPGLVGAVVLDDGTRLPADVVVEALGCVPNTEWLAATGLDIADGVRTDGWMRALDPEGHPRSDVVAVGDVARFPNALFDDVPRRVEHWSIPTDTAKRAAPALVAGLSGADLDPAPFAPMPSFWSDQYGARIQSFGSLGVADTVRVLEGDLDGEFVAGYERGGDLVGVVGVGLMPSLMKLRAEMITALQPR
ncbi:NAD(P)/FAD-dependent oxidoreductase [Kineosporia sp. R_H_3]|uniref:NAD(P)/FAD-dependent oxidoreductase n=1 Tax=Kineosporia sp. R_H_3 TaxID=1961848 RepID=UPI000B4BFC3B|nr:FAD-dependent oxidoreductase [Kineosporia sp. R_H_3]